VELSRLFADRADPLTGVRVRSRVRIGAVIVVALIGLGIAVLVSALGSHGSAVGVARPEPTNVSGTGPRPTPGASTAERTGATLFIHILGAVARPGLYELHDGDRLVDAVAAAGGLLSTADQSQVNLARFIVDGEQILVPAIGEAPAVTPGISAGGKVNLNTGDAAALDTLPGVGPATAARIIGWRTTNGRFTAIEDLMNVPGIGDKTFAQLKELITI